MKHIRKILALLVVAAMFAALGVSALAAQGDSSTEDAGKGSITIDNYESTSTYMAYKIFDVTYSDTTNPNDHEPDIYAYTIKSDSPWFNAVKAYADVAANKLTLTPVPGTSTTYTVEAADGFSAPAFAQHLYGYADGAADPTDITDSGAVEIPKNGAENLALGYWFVTTTTGALCNLTTTDPDVTIYDKNVVIFEKDVDDHTIEVGQTVTFTLTGKVPGTTGYTKYTYKVEDSMTDGLTLNQDVKIVFSDGTTKTVIVGTADTDETAYVAANNNNTAAPTVSYVSGTDPQTNKGFSFEFDMTKWQKYVNQDITITYTAKVNENAIENDEENNTAKLTYSNNPNDSTSTDHKDDEEHLYSFNIVIDKYKSGETTTKLEDAKFVLYKRGEATTTKPTSGDFDTVDVSGTETYYPITYYKYDDSTDTVSWVADKTAATEVETDSNGAAQFNGLEDGTYYLRETKAPDGYNLLDDPVVIVLTATEDSSYESAEHPEPYVLSATVDGTAATVNHTADNDDTADKDNDVTAGVANAAGTILPSTGGIGTTIFYVVGGILVAGAGVILITKRRLLKEQ